MAPNKTNHPSRKGIEIKPYKGGRSVRLPGGFVNPSEWSEIELLWKSSGLSWADFVLRLARNPTSFAADKGGAGSTPEVLPSK